MFLQQYQYLVTTSPNGIIWTLQYSNTTNSLYGITYGNGIFVVIGQSGTILTSPDGIIFTSKFSGTNKTLQAAIYNPSKLIVVGAQVVLLCKPYKEISVIPDVNYTNIFENTNDLQTQLQSVENDVLRLRDNVRYDSTTQTVTVGYKENLVFHGTSYAFRGTSEKMTLYPTKGSIWIHNDSYPYETDISMDINIKWGVKISTDDNFLYITKPGDSTKRVKIAWESI
jgi:hypothetical protein